MGLFFLWVSFDVLGVVELSLLRQKSGGIPEFVSVGGSSSLTTTTLRIFLRDSGFFVQGLHWLIEWDQFGSLSSSPVFIVWAN